MQRDSLRGTAFWADISYPPQATLALTPLSVPFIYKCDITVSPTSVWAGQPPGTGGCSDFPSASLASPPPSGSVSSQKAAPGGEGTRLPRGGIWFEFQPSPPPSEASWTSSVSLFVTNSKRAIKGAGDTVGAGPAHTSYLSAGKVALGGAVSNVPWVGASLATPEDSVATAPRVEGQASRNRWAPKPTLVEAQEEAAHVARALDEPAHLLLPPPRRTGWRPRRCSLCLGDTFTRVASHIFSTKEPGVRGQKEVQVV